MMMVELGGHPPPPPPPPARGTVGPPRGASPLGGGLGGGGGRRAGFSWAGGGAAGRTTTWSRPWPGGGAALQDAVEWWSIITDAVRRVADGTVARRSPSASPASGPAPSQSTPPASRSATASWSGPPGHPPRQGAHRWSRVRVRTEAAGHLGAQDRRHPGGNDPVGHMLILDRHHPDVAAAARWYLEPVDYLSMRFTGIAAHRTPR